MDVDPRRRSNRQLAEHVAITSAELDGYTVVTDLDRDPRELRGLHRRQPGQPPVHGGVQLELPPRVRGLSPLSPPAGDDGLSPPTRALIQGLADAAQTWSLGAARRRRRWRAPSSG